MSPTAKEHTATIELIAPSRLHFGLLPEGDPMITRRGGMGVMIENPCLTISACAGSDWRITGPLSDRVAQTVNLIWDRGLRARAPLHLHVKSAPPAHTGFGSGTQLSLGIAAILNYFQENPQSASSAFQNLLGRGARSKVGSEGFCRGGLIYDPGNGNASPTGASQNLQHFELPAAWRWLTVTCRKDQGLFGDEEANAFSQSVPEPIKRTQLVQLIESEMLCSLAEMDFNRFSSSLEEYGDRCGDTFSNHQHGLYRSADVAEVASRLKRAGAGGVGQSSWGPTIYGLFSSQETLAEFIAANAWLNDRQLIWRASATNFTGARLERRELDCA